LIRACAKPDNTAAWSEFISRYHSLIRSTAAAVARRWGQGALGERDDLTKVVAACWDLESRAAGRPRARFTANCGPGPP
jgi:hypothetical protein